MQFRFLVPALAVFATAPAIQAVELADGDVTLSFGIRLQSRIEFISASDAAGDDWDPWEEVSYDGTNDNDPQNINLMLRRSRLYLKGAFKEDTLFELAFFADEIGAAGKRDNDGVKVRYAWVGHQFESGEIEHFVQFGLDKWSPFTADTDSSSRMLFPVQRGNYTGWDGGVRVLGLGYQLTAPVFSVQLNVAEQDNDGGSSSVAPAGSANGDWFIGARVATAVKEEWQMKRTESALGKEGFGHEAGVSVALISDAGEVDGEGTIFGLDYNVHWNQLTGNADLVFISEDDGTTETDGMVFLVQAGWVLNPGADTLYEPAARIVWADYDGDDDDEAGVLIGEGGAEQSGVYLEAGFNIYFAGHSNKLQLALQSYTPEEGDGDAFVLRAQHQLNF